MGLSVKPKPPMRFHAPIYQPSTLKAGRYHFFWVSSMNKVPETTKPRPPTTWGVQ